MEKERARNTAAGVEPVPAAAGQSEGQPQSAFRPPVPVDRNVLLQQALARSMQVDQPEEAAQPAAETTSTIASAKQDEETWKTWMKSFTTLFRWQCKTMGTPLLLLAEICTR